MSEFEKIKDRKEVELRSEEVEEIMGQVSAWILRRGITILFIVLLVLLTGSFFFKYPDVISTEMTLMSTDPVAHMVARTNGRLSKIYIEDGQSVKKGDMLAMIENPADPGDVLRVENLLFRSIYSPDTALAYFLPVKEFILGEVQADYLSFLRTLHEYANHMDLQYYPKKIHSVKNQIVRYGKYHENQQRQHHVLQSQYDIAVQQYERDSLLYTREVISASEHETARVQMLQSRYSYEGSLATLENLGIQIAQMEENLLDLELQQMEKETILQQEFRTAAESLLNSINSWRVNYCLVTPVDGIVTFTSYWSENQYVTGGEGIFTVVPPNEEKLLGVASLPAARSGKVKVGQRVIIRFMNYPDQEFGIVNGVVNAISLVPNEANYRVEVSLPNGLLTNYKRELPVSQEMLATAEIVTEDLRLIERFFQPIKKIFQEGFASGAGIH